MVAQICIFISKYSIPNDAITDNLVCDSIGIKHEDKHF